MHLSNWGGVITNCELVYGEQSVTFYYRLAVCWAIIESGLLCEVGGGLLCAVGSYMR